MTDEEKDLERVKKILLVEVEYTCIKEFLEWASAMESVTVVLQE